MLLGLVIAMGVSSCMKEREVFDWRAQYELEKPIIEEYAKRVLTNPTFDENWGVWFEILEPGEAGSYVYKATEAPSVTVKYTGKLLNGTVFDTRQEDDGVKFSLGGSIIDAWPIAFFPKKIGDQEVNGLTANGLQKGTKIRFVTPSYLAYRERASDKIPANSPLDFEIEVLDITAPTSGN